MNTRHLQVEIPAQPSEISTSNNRFLSEIRVDRTKIRVLYLEGNQTASVPQVVNGRLRRRGAHSALQEALQVDPDIECVVLSARGRNIRVLSGPSSGLPASMAEMSAYDAIVCSDVSSAIFDEERMGWLEFWLSQRGGGLCMVGGANSFASGGWNRTIMKQMLPVRLAGVRDWNSAALVSVQADLTGDTHPLLRILEDDRKNRELLDPFPTSRGANLNLLPKPNLTTVLAVGTRSGHTPSRKLFTLEGIQSLFANAEIRETRQTISEVFVALALGQYGKGRTMAMAMPITGAPSEQLRSWGGKGTQYYAKFWRNAIYWLTENSFIGRRRLVVSADKRYYQPGDSIALTSSTYDAGGNPTSDYRVVAMTEPESFDNIESDYSIVRWPNNVERTSGLDGPFIAWGEEFELPAQADRAGQLSYHLELPIADAPSLGTANQSLRVELTAYEDLTQVDSTSVAIQVLHDPFEQQNPFPNSELLRNLAKDSGGSVLADASEIAQKLADLPVTEGPAEIRKVPVWSKWWLLLGLLGVLSTEWCLRRAIGLA